MNVNKDVFGGGLRKKWSHMQHNLVFFILKMFIDSSKMFNEYTKSQIYSQIFLKLKLQICNYLSVFLLQGFKV